MPSLLSRFSWLVFLLGVFVKAVPNIRRKETPHNIIRPRCNCDNPVRRLPLSGNKSVLASRLIAYQQEQTQGAAESSGVAPPSLATDTLADGDELDEEDDSGEENS